MAKTQVFEVNRWDNAVHDKVKHRGCAIRCHVAGTGATDKEAVIEAIDEAIANLVAERERWKRDS